MAWRKSPPALIAAFDAATPRDKRVEKRKMFGYPAFFAAGKMAAGCWQEFVVAKLPERDRDHLIASAGALPFEPMPGRRMKEYVVLPQAIVESPRVFANWLAKAADYAAATAKSAPGKKTPKKPGRAAAKSTTTRPKVRAKAKR